MASRSCGSPFRIDPSFCRLGVTEMKPQNREAFFCCARSVDLSFCARNVIASSRMNRRIIKALNTLEAAGYDQIMNVSDHTQRVFDSDLSKLTQMVAEMGGLVQ